VRELTHVEVKLSFQLRASNFCWVKSIIICSIESDGLYLATGRAIQNQIPLKFTLF